MRFLITFGHTSPSRQLPIDYQYYIGAWIYKVIGTADPAFAHFLHQFGYSDGIKSFKLFNYSPFEMSFSGIDKEKGIFKIDGDPIRLKVAFHLPDVAEKFIIGLFNKQQAWIGNREHGLQLKVIQVERIPEEHLSHVMVYRLFSPAVFSFKDENSKYARYAAPTDANYDELVKNHLEQKMKVAWANQTKTDQKMEINFRIDQAKAIKSKLIRVKPGKPEETKVRGFLYEFILDAPVEVHRMIMNCGFGEKNASGFGWVEWIEGE